MKKTEVVVPWEQGLHARTATRLVNLAKNYCAEISIRANGKVADAGSIISILLLCATVGTLLEIEAAGEDEGAAVSAIEQLFNAGDTSMEYGELLSDSCY